MEAILVKQTQYYRIYKLSEYLKIGKRFKHSIDLVEESKADYENIKPECKHKWKESYLNSKGINHIIISDAFDFDERLVFACYEKEGKYNWRTANIDGCNTSRMDGGDIRKCYKDEVYLRHLASINKLSWKGINT